MFLKSAKRISVILSVFVVVFIIACPGHAQSKNEGLQGRITISGAWALYPMAVKWAEEFQNIHPGIKIDISAGGAGKGIADTLSNVVDLGMVSRDIDPQEVKKGVWSLPVVKDAVVVTVNADNPALKDILAHGLKKDIFQGIFVSGKIKTWGDALNNNSTAAINVYTRSDSCGAAETWAKYLGAKQEDLMGIGVYGDPGVAQAVRKDKLGIGFNNINFAYDAKTRAPVAGIKIVPIDVNGDGRIDHNEGPYEDLPGIMAAVAGGEYPSPPARELYFISKGNPERREVRAFLHWVLSDGQKFVADAGFIVLSQQSIDEGLKKTGNE